METEETDDGVLSPQQILQSGPGDSSTALSPNIHVHFHSHHYSKVSTIFSSEEEACEINSETPASKNDGNISSFPSPSYQSVSPSANTSIDHRIERLLTSRTTIQKHIDSGEPPVLSFPYFDPSKMTPINFNLSLPTGLRSSCSLEASGSSDYSQGEDTSPLNKRLQLHSSSHLRQRLKNARKHVLFDIGLRSRFSEEKRLMTAVQNGDLAKVSSLLNDGVNANAFDAKRRTPLHIAASRGQYSIAHLLLAMGADPSMRDILGNAPLHLAVCRGDRQIVKLLIENGANIHSIDNSCNTPLSIVNSRLKTLRGDRNASTDTLKGEFLMMADFLQHHEKQLKAESVHVDDLCRLMEDVSTKEQADELADAMINKMSSLCIEKQNQTSSTLGHSLL